MSDKRSRGISNLPIQIQDVPDAPTVSAANVGTSRAYNNGAATVTVTKTTGGNPSSFTVTSNPGSISASGASPLTVTGLSSATSYTFTATATNASGVTSGASSASNSITATTVPQAPTIGTATATSATAATVAFTAGATGGSAITGYTATSSPGGITGTGASSPITVSGLTAGTTYTFTVTATNANGTSTASAASNSATPLYGVILTQLSDGNTTANQTNSIEALVTDSSNNIYAVGYLKSSSNSSYFSSITKLNSSGTIQWTRQLADGNAAGSQQAFGRGVAVDSSGNVYVCGRFKNTSGGYNIFIAKYNSSGTIQWQRLLRGTAATASQNDDVTKLVIDSSNNIYVSGTINGFTWELAKYDTNGTILWQWGGTAIGNSTFQTAAQGIALDSSNNVYSCGWFGTNSSGQGGKILKHDSSGTFLAESFIFYTGTYSQGYFYDIKVDSSNNIYAVGIYDDSSVMKLKIAKFDTNLNLVWERIIGNSNNMSNIASVYTDSSGNVYAIGRFIETGSEIRTLITKYNSSGTIQWQRRLYETGYTYNYVYSTEVTVNSSGNIIVSGYAFNSSNGQNGFLFTLPSDGTGTGTYTVPSGISFIYDTSSLTAANGASSTRGLTYATQGTGVDAANTLTDSASPLTASSISG